MTLKSTVGASASRAGAQRVVCLGSERHIPPPSTHKQHNLTHGPLVLAGGIYHSTAYQKCTEGFSLGATAVR